MKITRNIVVKANFSPDEYVSLKRKCAAADISQSRMLREGALKHWTPNCSHDWSGHQHDRRRPMSQRSPAMGHVRPMSLPCQQINYGITPKLSIRV